MVSPAELRTMFEARLKEGVPNPPGEFHPLDLEKIKDDKYLNTVIALENNAKLALDMLWDIMVWRKIVGANDINENNIRMDYINEGFVFPRGRDIDGCLLFIIKWKQHAKGSKNMQELEKVFIYWLDRLEREEGGKKITLFIDIEGCGLKSVDIDLIKCLIALFKSHYPYLVKNVIIYEMPWMLSATFKVIKKLLPAKAVQIMKFVSKDNLKDIVPPEQALTCWGGMDDYTFQFVPEKSGEHKPKKVPEVPDHHTLGEMLRLIPNDVIIFKNDNEGEVSAQLTITNMDENAISFKIRTTSPGKFKLKPSSGTLSPRTSQTVLIVVQRGFQLHTVSKDKFLVMSVRISRTDLSHKELSEVWQNSSGSKVDEYRLKCHFSENNVANSSIVINDKAEERDDSVMNALNNLQIKYETLNRTLKTTQYIQVFILFLTLVVVKFVYLIYQNQEALRSCSNSP